MTEERKITANPLPANESCDHESCCQCCHHADHGLDDLDLDQGLDWVFQGELCADQADIWQHLTDNQYLKKWQNKLTIDDLRAGGSLAIDGHRVLIADLEEPSLLSFLQGEDMITLEFEAGQGAQTFFTLNYWMANSQELSAHKLEPWLLLLTQLETFLQTGSSKLDPQRQAQIHDSLNSLIDQPHEQTLDL